MINYTPVVKKYVFLLFSALVINTQNEETLQMMIDIYRKLGNVAKALNYAQQRNRINPNVIIQLSNFSVFLSINLYELFLSHNLHVAAFYYCQAFCVGLDTNMIEDY